MHGRHREASRQRHVPGLFSGPPPQVQPAALQQLHGSRDLPGPWQLRPRRHLRLLRRLLRHLLPGLSALSPTPHPSHLTVKLGSAGGPYTHVSSQVKRVTQAGACHWLGVQQRHGIQGPMRRRCLLPHCRHRPCWSALDIGRSSHYCFYGGVLSASDRDHIRLELPVGAPRVLQRCGGRG